jgi:hypothetical protein
MHSAPEWVVTYRMPPFGGCGECDACTTAIAEFFRGPPEECARIARAFGGGECDIVRTNPWTVVIGPAEDWDRFMSCEDDS